MLGLGFLNTFTLTWQHILGLGGQWLMVRVVVMFLPAWQHIFGQIRRLGGQQLGQEVRKLVVRLGCWSRLGAQECSVAHSQASLGQWHIALSHKIAIYGRCHVTNARQGELGLLGIESTVDVDLNMCSHPTGLTDSATSHHTLACQTFGIHNIRHS